jgi:hypothetical protein
VRPPPSALRIKAIYSIGELARAACIERRQLRKLLILAGVEFTELDKGGYVYLVELELKARPLWEAIKAVQSYLEGLP